MTGYETTLEASRDLGKQSFTLSGMLTRIHGDDTEQLDLGFYGDFTTELPSFDGELSFSGYFGQYGGTTKTDQDTYYHIFFQPALRLPFGRREWIRIAPRISYGKALGEGTDDGDDYTYDFDILGSSMILYGRYHWLRAKAELSYFHWLGDEDRSEIRPRLRVSTTHHLDDIDAIASIPFLRDLSISTMFDIRYRVRQAGKGYTAWNHRTQIGIRGSLSLTYKPFDWLAISLGESISATLRKGEDQYDFTTFLRATLSADNIGEFSFMFFFGESPTVTDY